MAEEKQEVQIEVQQTEEPHADPYHGKHESKGFRRDEKWTEAYENLCREWLESAKEASAGHNAAGKTNKCKHAIFGLTSVLVPLVFSPVSVALDDDPSLPYVSMVGFIVTGVFGAVDQFFDYSGKHARHMDFSARYGDVVSDIKYELAKGREYRIDPDEFLMKIQMKMDNNSSSAPDL